MWWLSWQMQHPASVVNKCCCWALPWASAVFWFNWSSKERYLCWDLIFTSLLVCCYQGGEGKEGVMDDRTTHVPSLQYKILYQHVTLSSEFSIQGVTGSHSQSIYELTLPTQPMMWVMWCDCVKVGHTTRVYVPYTFRTVVWVLLRFTRTRYVSVSALRQDLWFFVFIQED